MTAKSNPIEILQVTDPHILPTPQDTLMGMDTAYYLDAVLKLATSFKQRYDLCLLTGDLVQTPCAEAYVHLLSILKRYNLHFTCLPGNHDDVALMKDVLQAGTVDCRKQIILGSWQIICLNSSVPGSNSGYVPEGELVFLEECLGRHRGLLALIAVHHHCLPSGSEWMDTMIIKNGAELTSILKKYPNAKALINGHIHQQIENTLETFQVLSTPSTCFQFAPKSREFKLDNAMPGYRRLRLYSDGNIETEVFRLPGPFPDLKTDAQGY